jgi:hypothetical protein
MALNGNFCFTPPTSPAPKVNCMNYAAPYTDTTSTISNDILDGGAQALSIMVGSPTLVGGWFASNADYPTAQGPVVSYGAVGTSSPSTVTINHCISLLHASLGNLVDLFFSEGTGGGQNTYISDHDTFVGYGDSVGTYFGEGVNNSTQAIVNSKVTNSIFVKGKYGMVNGNSNDTFTQATGCPTGVGVCNNLTYGQSTAPYQMNGSFWSPGFNQATACGGTDAACTYTHPNAYLGDLTINPAFVNPAVTVPAFNGGLHSPCQIGGGIAGFMTNLGARTGFGTYQSQCSIPNNSTWLFGGFAPTAGPVAHAATDGTYIGAVPVVLTSNSNALWFGGPL